MQQVVTIEQLPETALDAAEAFRETYLADIREILEAGDDVAIVLPGASYDHEDWRKAVVRDLARAHAPARVNMVSGDGSAAIEASLAYLAKAPGVTGQYLPLAGAGRHDTHG